MSEKTSPVKKTYYGVTALITGIVSSIFFSGILGIPYLNITFNTFNMLNNFTALFFCILTPLTFVLGVVGHARKNDSKTLSRIAIALVTIPFLIIFSQLVYSFIR